MHSRHPLIGLAFLLTAGCVPAGVSYTAYSEVYPPAPYDEVVGPSPGERFVWVNGYWWWDGTEYVWVRGYWAVPPQPGYVWVRSGWMWEGDRYVFVRGRWVGSSVRARHHYVHPRARVRVQRGSSYRHVAPRGRTRVRRR